VSANGRYEILEAVVPVPVTGNVREANIRQMRGGMRISMPQESQYQSTAQQVESSSGRIDGSGAGDSQMSVGGGHVKTQATASNVQTRRPPTPSSTLSDVGHIPPPRAHMQQALRPRLILPPSTDIEVEDAEFPWPEKHPDASEGWVDNRGEFQAY